MRSGLRRRWPNTRQARASAWTGSLCSAFGLRPAQGATSWWAIEGRGKRDTLIRAIAARHFGGAGRRAAAIAIRDAVARYKAAGWRRHQAFTSPPAELLGTLRGDLFAVLKVGQKVSFKTIYGALRVCPEDGASRPMDTITL